MQMKKTAKKVFTANTNTNEDMEGDDSKILKGSIMMDDDDEDDDTLTNIANGSAQKRNRL